jgi:hypothetical protein
VHHHATFEVEETLDRFRVTISSDDGHVRMAVAGRRSSHLPSNSIFRSVEDASQAFYRGSVGYSATANQSAFEGLELRAFNWHLDPLAIETVQSSYFEDEAIFPQGSVEFDSAFLMQGIHHEWIGRPPICMATSADRLPRTATANRGRTTLDH